MNGSNEFTGAADGGVRSLLRVEGLLLLSCAVAFFWRGGGDWRLFAILFLAPDLSFLGYVAGSSIGAAAYNAMHSTIGPLLLGAASVALGQQLAITIALIWLAHVGFDRSLGFGLKHTKGIGFTHLGRIGRARQES